MSKPYQHHEEPADQGKAVPVPWQPTQYTYRGAGGFSVSVDPIELREERAARKQAHAAKKSYIEKQKISLSIVAAVRAVLGFTRRFGRDN